MLEIMRLFLLIAYKHDYSIKFSDQIPAQRQLLHMIDTFMEADIIPPLELIKQNISGNWDNRKYIRVNEGKISKNVLNLTINENSYRIEYTAYESKLFIDDEEIYFMDDETLKLGLISKEIIEKHGLRLP